MLTPFRVAILVPIAILMGFPLFQHFHLPLDAADKVVERPKPSTLPPTKRTVFANGITEGIDRNTPLRFEISGRLKNLHVQVGDAVTQGQVLAELVADDWKINLAKAEANLQQARAEQDLLIAGATQESIATARAEARVAYEAMDGAKKQYERVLRVKETGVITGEEIDRRKATYLKTRASYVTALAKLKEVAADAREEELRAAEAKVAIAEAAVSDAKYTLSKASLVAPIDGIILESWGEPGQLSGADAERPIVVMVDATEKRVRAFVEELDASHVNVGDVAHVTTDGQPNTSAKGTVIRCAPAMVEKTAFDHEPGERSDTRVREVTIRLEPNAASNQLLIGQPADVMIEVSTKLGQGPSVLSSQELRE